MISTYFAKKSSLKTELVNKRFNTILNLFIGWDHQSQNEIILNGFPQYLIKLSEEMLCQAILSLSLINPVEIEYHRFACCVEEKG